MEDGMEELRRRGVARLMLRWPDLRAELKQRARQDSAFSDLCGAYEDACAAAEQWARSAAAIARERTQEYRDLASDTEQDILHLLRYKSNNR
jgi:hypothetical protein